VVVWHRGGTRQTLATEQQQRDQMTLVYQGLIGLFDGVSIKNNPAWTKAFYWHLFSAANDTMPSGMIDGSGTTAQNDSAQLRPREAYWALSYLARSWQGAPTISYAGFNYAQQTWMTGADHSDAGTTGLSQPLWGMSAQLDSALPRAGWNVCYSVHLNNIADTVNNGGGGWCNGQQITPQTWGAPQSHALEAFWMFSTGAPLLKPDSTPMQICYISHVSNHGWEWPAHCEHAQSG
jgi:hypothetical protein